MQDYPTISLIPIETSDKLQRVVHLAFDTDSDLYLYHISTKGRGTIALAEHTFRAIKEEMTKFPLECYSIEADFGSGDKHPIGFTVLSNYKIPLMYSFGIKPEFRKKEILINWMGAVRAKFEDGYFLVSLNAKNTRAISFMEKNGFEVTNIDEFNNTLILSPCLYLEE